MLLRVLNRSLPFSILPVSPPEWPCSHSFIALLYTSAPAAAPLLSFFFFLYFSSHAALHTSLYSLSFFFFSWVLHLPHSIQLFKSLLYLSFSFLYSSCRTASFLFSFFFSAVQHFLVSLGFSFFFLFFHVHRYFFKGFDNFTHYFNIPLFLFYLIIHANHFFFLYSTYYVLCSHVIMYKVIPCTHLSNSKFNSLAPTKLSQN